ncbi:MAG TPA: tetratricopeptide repeat protein [Usitatibacter sp.]|nr:tetratricopeptide repeat protein [Usitatibacter sp.]
MAGSYDFEEQERLAELKAWWEDNRWFVIAAAVVGLLALAGWEGWKLYRERRAEDAAAMHRPVEAALKANDPKKLADAGKALIDKHPRSFFASESALQLAKTAFEAGNLAEARRQLQWVTDNGVEELRGVARLRLAAVMMEEKKYDEALKTLDANKEEAFVAPAADLRGDIMLAQGRLDEARAAYKLAIEKSDPRNPVKGIAETKLNALGGAK